MDEPKKSLAELLFTLVDDRLRRVVAERVEYALDASHGRDRVSESKTRCDEPDDLPIAGVDVPMGVVDRVVAPPRLGIEGLQQAFQALLGRIHSDSVLAILVLVLQWPAVLFCVCSFFSWR